MQGGMMNKKRSGKIMMKMKAINKKGMDVDPIKLIVGFVLIGIVFGLFLYFFTDTFGKQASDIRQKAKESTGDYDRDFVPDIVDKCPCDTSPPGKQEYGGCATKDAPPRNRNCLK